MQLEMQKRPELRGLLRNKVTERLENYVPRDEACKGLK